MERELREVIKTGEDEEHVDLSYFRMGGGTRIDQIQTKSLISYVLLSNSSSVMKIDPNQIITLILQ